MKRTFDSAHLVMLPILDASSALAVGEETLTVAKEESLEGPLALSLRRLKQSLVELSEASRARLDAAAGENARTEAHRVLGSAWSVCHDWLKGWAGLSEDRSSDKVAVARRIFAAMFVDGLKFLLLRFESTWVESNQRLKWLAEQDADESFRLLGGLDFLEEIRAAHDAYGEALAITKPRAAAELPSIREPLDAFCARLRQYVLQVAAHADLGDQRAQERAERLLAPLARWQATRARSSRVEETPEAPPAPQPEPAPAPVPPSTPPVA